MPAIFQSFPMLPGRRAQVWHHQPSFRRPRHFHPEPELNVITRGYGVLAVGTEHLVVGPGSAVLLQPGQDHELLAESPDFELFVLALDPQMAEHCQALIPRQLCRIELDAGTLGALRDSWLAAREMSEPSVVERLLGEQFSRLVTRFDAPSALGRRAVSALRTNLDTSESSLADDLCTHPSDVSRAVRRVMGMRLVDYRVRLRLIRFIEHVDGGHSLTQAAFMSGFGSYAQCHRVFWRHLECTPRAYFDGERTHVNDKRHPAALANGS